MGDDNEIRQLIHREAEDFLKKARAATKDVHEVYDLEGEFRKTRKNRSLLVPLVTIVTLAVLGLVAWGVANRIQAMNNAAPVDVASFEDLNLKDLLDTAKRNADDLSNAQSDLQQLNFDLKSSLDSADRDYAAAIETLRAKTLSAAELARQSADALSARDAKKRQIQASFTQRIAAKKAEIAAIQTKIDSYDQRMMKQAKDQQAVLDSATKKFDLEKQQLVSDYEHRLADLAARRQSDIASLTRQRETLAATLVSRYNPVFSDDRMVALLKGWKAPATYGPFPPLPDYLVQSGAMSAADSANLDVSLSDFGYIADRLHKVPWINSVPGAVSRLEGEGMESALTYRNALVSAATELQTRDRSIAALTDRATKAETERNRLDWAIGSYADAQRESGFVVDPRDPTAVVIVMNPSVPVSDGILAYVVRGEKSIATMKLTVRDGVTIGAVASIVDGETMQPFDSVLVSSTPSP